MRASDRQNARNLRRQYGEESLRTAIGLPGEMVEFNCIVEYIGHIVSDSELYGLVEDVTGRKASWRSHTIGILEDGGHYRLRGKVTKLEPLIGGFTTWLTRCKVTHIYGKGEEHATT